MKAPFRALPSRKDLLDHFYYNEIEGKIYKRANDRLLSTGFKRYRKERNGEPWMYVVSCKGVQYPAHRVIWKMVTGNDPSPLTIDHIDRNPFNNKWENLRLADAKLQSQNREWKKTKGHKGISFHKATQKWSVRITQGKTRRYLGVYKTKEEAIKVLNEYEKI
jgi:hypothetical protein